MTGMTRRRLMQIGTVSAVPFGALTTHSWAAATSTTAGRREPAGTELRTINGTGVVFQYGTVVPSFDGWRTEEPTREYADLNGSWRFTFDSDAVGEEQGWHRTGFDDSAWSTISVPSAWDLFDTPDFGGYDGTDFGQGTAFVDGFAWYRTTVDVPGDWAHRVVRLNFLAVNYRADVWVNGRFVGAHEGGHNPFALPVRSALRPGRKNQIAVRVDRRASFEDYTQESPQITDEYAIPWKPVDYWPYAGITRGTWLEAVPRVTIAKLLLRAGDGELEARVVVENHDDDAFAGQVTVDPGRRTGGEPLAVQINVPAGEVRVALARIAIPEAAPWDPASPVVHEATASIRPGSGPRTGARPTMDQLSSTYGALTVEVNGGHIVVNGDPVFLKGLNWHEETAEHGRSMTHDDYDRELGHVTNTGGNLIRNTVYTRDPYVYDWADRHGVFVMDDIDNMWINTAQEKLQTEQYGLSRALALAMAWNQHNHPSVLLWCLQNESEIDADGAPIYRAWLSDMKDAIKAVDLADRPVTWASSTTNDPAFDLADVIGFNEYFGYFYGTNDDLGPAIDDVHQRFPNRPIVITENGSWSYLGHHGPVDEEGTEEWQAANFVSHWEQVTQRPDYVAGYVFWVLKDYKQRLNYNQDLNGISVMGMLGFDSVTTRLVHDEFQAADTPHFPR